MSVHSTNLTDESRAENTVGRTCWYVVQVLPVTLTVVLGPFISIAYHLTQRMDTTEGSFSVAQAARGLLCMLMFFSMLLSKELNLLRHRLVRPLLFLAAYAVLTSLASPYRYLHIVFAVRLTFLVLVFASTFRLAKERICTERWLKTCAWVILLVMAISIGVGLATGRTVAVYKSRFATAGFIRNNCVTSYLILSSLPIFISLIPTSSSGMAATVVLFTSLFFTMRRTSLIAGAAATCSSALTYLISCWRRMLWRRILVFIGVFILLAGVGIGTAAGADLIERFRDLNPFTGKGSGRYVVWRISLEHIMHRPMHVQLLGEGMGSLNNVIKQKEGYWVNAHNDWLNFAGAFGLCGVIGISWWFFELARLTWSFRCRQNDLFQGACAALVMLGLISIGTGGFFRPSWALTYAALGFWGGRVTCEGKQHHARSITL